MPQLSLTDTKLKALVAKPPSVRTSYYDANTPGLSVRVSPSGTASWTYRFRVSGEGGTSVRGFDKKGDRYRVHLGRFPKVGVKAARAKATSYDAMAERGENPVSGMTDAAHARRLTVKKLAEYFDASYIEENIRAKQKYRDAIEVHIIPHLGKKPASTLTSPDITSLATKVKKKRKRSDGRYVGGVEAARTTLVVMQKMLGWAMAVGHVDYNGVNPAHGVSANALPSHRSRDRHLSIVEARAVFRCAPELDNATYAALYRLILLTACRPHELTGRTWNEIDLDQALMIVPQTKQDRVKVVPLVPRAVEIIAALPRHRATNFVLPNSRGGFLDKWSSKVHGRMKVLIDEEMEQELENWTAYDLRRTVATRLGEQGTDEKIIKRVLDHADGSATAIYNRYAYTREIRTALELWAEELLRDD